MANIVLDTRLTHNASGGMHPFWANLLTGLLVHMQQSNWLCTVQLQSADAPVLPASAPGVLLATSDTGRVSLFVRDAFGQTVVSPIPSVNADGPQAILQHDYQAIGAVSAAHFIEASCRCVLLMGRPGFGYSEAIVDACARALQTAGVQCQLAPSQGSTSQRIDAGLTDEIDGMLDLTGERNEVLDGLLGRKVVPSRPALGELVVVTNVDGSDPHDRTGMARLSLEGQRCGARVADYFITMMTDSRDLPAPVLPFCIYPAL